MDMSEYDFVNVHKGVVDTVITKRSFQEIIAMLKLSTFARRSVVPAQVVEDIPQVPVPDASTSKIEPKPKMKTKGKGKGKGKGKKSKKAEEKVEIVVETIPDPVEMLPTDKLTISTQTDSDFEDFLEMTKKEIDEYEQYKQQQIYQQYLCNNIFVEEFDDEDWWIV